MQTPSAVRQLEIKSASVSSPNGPKAGVNADGASAGEREDGKEGREGKDDDPEKNGLAAGASASGIIHFDLREEGNHTLSVAVSYNEAVLSKPSKPSPPSKNLPSTTSTTPNLSNPSAAHKEPAILSSRLRSFRKLYSFVVGPCLSVRTKATSLSSKLRGPDGGGSGGESGNGNDPLERFALECQLENLADDIISVEKLVFEAKLPFGSRVVDFAAPATHLQTSSHYNF